MESISNIIGNAISSGIIFFTGYINGIKERKY
jgi:hypothetical protein